MKKLVSLLMALSILVGCAMPALATDSVEYSTKGGSWDKVSDDMYAMDKDGDGTSDVTLTQDGNTWNYDFAVGDDTAPYYGWEDGTPEGYDVDGRGTAANPVYSGNYGEVGETVYSHTSNFNDDGTFTSGTYASNQNKVDVVTVPGATELYVNLRYELKRYEADYVCMWAGAVDFDTITEELADESLTGRITNTSGWKTYVVPGDTVSFGFVAFDDGGLNNSYTANKLGYYAEVVGFSYVSDEVKYSHTPNMGDDGIQFDPYGDNLDITDVVTVPGADKLRVDYVVGFDLRESSTGNADCDAFCLWSGAHDGYDAYDQADLSDFRVAGNPSNNVGDGASQRYEGSCIIDGDTVTVGFHTNDRLNYGYGYYLKVVGLFIDGSQDCQEVGTVGLNDDGTVTGGYADNLRQVDVVTIPGAKQLSVDIVYQCQYYNSYTFPDCLYVMSGAYPDFDFDDSDFIRKNAKRLCSSTLTTVNYVVDGDSVTFGFQSDDSDNWYIGYRAKVTVVEPSEEPVRYISNQPLRDDNSIDYGYGDNVDYADVIKCDGASKLMVTLTCQLSSDENDTVAVWAGEHPDYRVGVNGDTIVEFLSNDVSAVSQRRFLVDGDSVTVGFKSDDRFNNAMGYAICVVPLFLNGLSEQFDASDGFASVTLPGSNYLCLDFEYDAPVHWTGDLMYEWYVWPGNEVLDSDSAILSYLDNLGSHDMQFLLAGDSVTLSYSAAYDDSTCVGTVFGVDSIGSPVYSSSIEGIEYDSDGFAVVPYSYQAGDSKLDVVRFEGADAIKVDYEYCIDSWSASFGIWGSDKTGYVLSDSSSFSDVAWKKESYTQRETSSLVLDTDVVSIGFLASHDGYGFGYRVSLQPIYYGDVRYSQTNNVTTDDEGNVVPLVDKLPGDASTQVVSFPGAKGLYVEYFRCKRSTLNAWSGSHPDYNTKTSTSNAVFSSYSGRVSQTHEHGYFFVSGDTMTVVPQIYDTGDGRYGYVMRVWPVSVISTAKVLRSENLQEDGSWRGSPGKQFASEVSFDDADALLVDLAVVSGRNTNFYMGVPSRSKPGSFSDFVTGTSSRWFDNGSNILVPGNVVRFEREWRDAARYPTEYGFHAGIRPLRIVGSSCSKSENVGEHGGFGFSCGFDVNVSEPITVTGAIGLKVSIKHNSSNYRPGFAVWEGVHPEYDAVVDSKLGLSSGGYESSLSVYYVPGDSVTIGFSNREEYFSDPSFSRDNYRGYYAKIEPVFGDGRMAVSHSENLDDDGKTLSSGMYSYGANMDYSESVRVDGADALRVTIKYDTKSDAYFCAWDQYDESLRPSLDWASSFTGKLSGSNGDADWIVDGNAVTLGFRSLTAGRDELGYYVQVTPLKAVNGNYVSHTANIADDGSRVGSYSPNTDKTDVISVPGADFLVAQLDYCMNSSGSYVGIWEGSHDDWHPVTDRSSFRWFYSGSRYSSAINSRTLFFDGDSLTFGFHSDGSSVYSGNSGYGYFSKVYAYSILDCGSSFHHLPNLDDTGHSNFGYGNNRKDSDSVVFPGASKLWVKLRYQFADNKDYLRVYDQHVSSDDLFSGNAPSHVNSFSSTSVSEKSFLVDSDTVSFGLFSNDSGHNAYGYYAEVYPVWEPGSVDGNSNMVITNKKRETTFAKGNVMFTKQVEGGTVTKVSHMSNLDDDGNVLSSTYRNNESFTDVVTVPGATKLSVDIMYQTESTSYDWACVWAGNHPEYTAYSNYGSSVSGKLGGTTKKTVHYDVEGDSVTFGFRSDGSENGYYGYHAVVTSGGASGKSRYGFDVMLSTELDGLEKYIMGKQEFGDVVFYDGKAFLYAVPGEPVSIKGVPEGVEWSITERPSEGTESVSWQLGDMEVEGDTVSGVVVGDVTANAVCLNTVEAGDSGVPRLDLTVNKSGDVPADEEFDFTLKLWGLEPECSYATSAGDSIISDSLGIGLASFKLAMGQSFVVHGLPAGCSYDVEEVANRCISSYSIECGSGAGFKSDENSVPGMALSTGKRTTAEGDAPVVTFTNRSPVETVPETVDVTVRKTWVGGGDKPDSIGFNLFEGNDLVGSGILDEDSGWTMTFHSLPKFRGDGITSCEYEIRETTVPGFESSVSKVSDVEFEITNSHVDTGSLRVSKTVDGYDNITGGVRDTKFVFDIAAYSPDGSAVTGEYVTSGSVEGTVEFEDGHASVQVGHGESVVIEGLPAGAHCIVTEQEDENFVTVDGAVRDGDITVDGELELTYTNRLSEKGEAEMPETGGPGIHYYVIGGALMLVFGLLLLRKKKPGNVAGLFMAVLLTTCFFGMNVHAAEPVIVETFNISLESGATLTDGNYVWAPTEPSKDHKFVYRLDYSLSGMFSSEPGSLRFELPMHIFKNRDGRWADTFECAYRHEAEIGKDDSPDFAYRFENGKVVIYNYSSYETGTSGYIEFAYVTAEPTFEYVDMSPSINVDGKLTVTNLGETVTATASGGAVAIDTGVELKSVEKYTPTFYDSWISSWGEKPDDADQWLYLIWPVCASFSKVTQPYDLILEDAFSDMGGSVVGYRFSNRGTFMSDGTITGLRKYGSLWVYVLTRHSKSEVEAVLSSADNYAVDNVVRATVTPCDKIDAPSRKQGTATWVYQVPEYEAPDGHFWAKKYGIYNTRERVKSSEDVSNFYLAEFQSGDIDTLEHLKFEAYVKGYPYPWTMGEGADGTINDALNGLYGQKEVMYSLTDDSFTIGDIGYNGFCAYLEDGDYDMRRILFYPTMLSAKFDPDMMKFVEQPAHWGSYDKSDNPVFEFRVGKDEWVKGFEFDMNTFYLLDMNEKYITGYGGAEVALAKGVKGVRVRCSNAYWYTNMSLTPVIDIYRTDHVLKYLGDGLSGTTVPVTNHAHAEVTQDGEVLFERDVYGTDYIKKATRTSEIQKRVTATHNDRVGRVVHVTWRSNVRESVVGISGKGSVYQKSGVFYELLPKGALLRPDTVSVEASGNGIPETQYDVELIPNYKDSGRTMMKIDIKTGTEDAYVVKYTTTHTWASVKDHGKRLLSSVAYESGNMSLAGGSKDNGGKLEDRVIMADVSDNDRDVFLYADARHTLDVLTAGSTGLMKQVSAGDGTCFTYESSVGLNDLYTYRVRYENDATTASRDIMFFDSIENFFQRETDKVPTMESDWKGILQSIDLSQLRARGAKPVAYLSNMENLNPYEYRDVGDKSVWLEYDEFVEKYGLGAVRAICVDARKGLNGSDFVLGKGNSLSFDIVLKAPSEAASVDDKAYNNIFASMSIIKDTSEGIIPKFFHQDYTTLGLRVTGDLAFNKVDALDVNVGIAGVEFLLSGTSDYGNLVNLTATSDMDGSVIFTDVELGTYELIETNCSPDWQLSHDVYIVTVGLSGDCDIKDAQKDRDGIPCIPNEARVHGDVVFYKADGVSGRLLNGATFRLAGTSDYGNEVLETATSVLGCVSFNNIETGLYKMAEVTPADGYIPSKATWDVRVNSMGVAEFPDGLDTNDLGRPVIKNEKYHSVRFVKTSTYGENVYLGGAEFALSGISDYGHEIDLTATSSDAADGGLVVFTGLEPGTYVLKETKAPEDHGLNEQEYVVNVHADDSYEIIGLDKISFGAGEVYEMKDPKTKGTVRVTKKWDDDLLNVDRPIPDITISTKRLVKDAVNYSVCFNSNGGLFSDGSRELTATYMRNGKFVSGEITDPYVENAEYATFKGWYTQETGGKQVMLSADGDLDIYVADGLTLYARYVFKPRYAVSVWGIGRDLDEDGKAMGLTFGPALRVDTSGSYKRHVPDGATASGNEHRCVHMDTWDTIIEWNKKDPYVYEQCVANNCSKAVEVDTGAIGGSLESTLSSGYGSDGGNVLVVPGTSYSASAVACDWGKSQLRAMLNGPDSLTSSNNCGSYSDTVNLYNCFPEAIRNAMGRAAVRYDPAGGGNTEENTLVSYDFLWLPSVNDMCSAVLDGQGKVSADNHPYEGTAYGKFGDVKGMKPGSKTTKWFCVNAGGGESSFPMRSLSGTGTKYMYYNTNGLQTGSLTTKQSYVTPCFSLKR